ncbi:MAG TPA: carbamoyltransferase HypF [Syntrophorhabdales bacterium]|nr:carbamoyltransferase HypF [Syntrophorhabdales bacterium]
MAPEARQLRHISVQGVVQGVGFRPFIFRLAHEYNLAGWVLNTSSGVEIEVEGIGESISRFLDRLVNDAPPLAHIEGVQVTRANPAGYVSFEIRESLQDAGYQLISPDIATCHECAAEIFLPRDRRYRYPFTNCTNCGPRFTIIADIPYDRPNTTMSKFQMCEACSKEYEDPLNRRFHAQPNACPVCGPRVWLENAAGEKVDCNDVITEAARLLATGAILAIKGLGGVHLACDAYDEKAVDSLRKRKGRPDKPLAVMVRDLDEVRRECFCDEEEEALLSSPHAPIVLLIQREESRIARNVAPGNNYLGAMLAYTPLHLLLLADFARPLVMTSGNITEEPIAKDNEEAKQRLKGLADFFLLHDRDIHSRYDDSVYIVTENKPQSIRRARSYAPFPITLPFGSTPLLAVGAQEKNSFCLTRDQYAFVSQHIGDLDNIETLEHFAATIELYKKLFRIKPELITHDLHPDYLSTRYALEMKGEIPIVGVQHHHAHIASCMADNGITEPVIGVAFDGSGFGLDGTVWGGEFIIARLDGFERVARIEPLPMPGGELAIKKPYRLAIAYLYHLLGSIPDLPFAREVSEEEKGIIIQQLEKGINTPLTSSCGRLFDAVSALLNVREAITFEGQAAIELEMLSRQEGDVQSYAYGLAEHDGMQEVRVGQLLEEVLNDVRSGVPVHEIGLRFHETIAHVIKDVSARVAAETGISRVALSGGCFQNRLLLRRALPLLREAGLEVLLHSQVPCNDGGISLGQAAIANAIA